MRPEECLRILGVPATASRRDIKRAYRRLALASHPDTHPGDEGARRRFIRLSEAYQTLIRTRSVRERGREVGVCANCGQFAEVFRSSDGKVLCERCVLRPGARRLLPLPAIVVVKCAFSFILNAVAIICLLHGCLTGSIALLAVACAAGFLGMMALAVTCLSVRYCTQPDETALYRRLAARQTNAEDGCR